MVPNGWTPSQIGDIAKFTSGGTPSKQCAEFWGGTEPWISGKDLKTHYLTNSIDTLTEAGYKIAKKAPKGSSLILVRGMTLLKDFPVGYATRDVAFNQDLKALVPEKNVDGLFLSFLLVSEKHKLLQLVSTAGHGTGRMDTHSIQEYPVNLPPLPEQKKIAQILSTWDKAITTTEQLLANSQRQKKALMQQLLTGKKRLLDRNGVRFSGEWKSYLLGDWLREYSEKSVANDQHEVLTSSRGGLVKQSEYFADSRIAQRENLGFNVIPPGCITYRSRSDDGLFFFNRNDFPFTGIISTYYPVFNFPEGDTNFFLNLLNRNAASFSGYSVGTSQKVLSLNALKSVRVRLPEREEQIKIATVLATADQEITGLQQKLGALKKEKKALMQQLLTGKRRVKLDDKEAA